MHSHEATVQRALAMRLEEVEHVDLSIAELELIETVSELTALVRSGAPCEAESPPSGQFP